MQYEFANSLELSKNFVPFYIKKINEEKLWAKFINFFIVEHFFKTNIKEKLQKSLTVYVFKNIRFIPTDLSTKFQTILTNMTVKPKSDIWGFFIAESTKFSILKMAL